MSPRPPKWFLWERVFPLDFQCSREIEQDNWPVVLLAFPDALVGQLSGSLSLLHW
jgi:hypothetical protein